MIGNPFPYSASLAFDAGSQAYTSADGARTSIVVGQEILPNSNEGAMQTANSLPPGYAGGAVTFLAGKAPAA